MGRSPQRSAPTAAAAPTSQVAYSLTVWALLKLGTGLPRSVESSMFTALPSPLEVITLGRRGPATLSGTPTGIRAEVLAPLTAWIGTAVAADRGRRKEKPRPIAKTGNRDMVDQRQGDPEIVMVVTDKRNTSHRKTPLSGGGAAQPWHRWHGSDGSHKKPLLTQGFKKTLTVAKNLSLKEQRRRNRRCGCEWQSRQG